MSTLTESGTKAGLLIYATTKGSDVKMAARHVVDYTELPDHNLFVSTSRGDRRLVFDNSTDCDAAKVVLDNALAG